MPPYVQYGSGISGLEVLRWRHYEVNRFNLEKVSLRMRPVNYLVKLRQDVLDAVVLDRAVIVKSCVKG